MIKKCFMELICYILKIPIPYIPIFLTIEVLFKHKDFLSYVEQIETEDPKKRHTLKDGDSYNRNSVFKVFQNSLKPSSTMMTLKLSTL